ncbi:MAG: ABC transporter substrate-binding protein [Pseudorhodoplanes sp.]
MRRFLLATFGLFAILTLSPLSTASARDEIRIGVTGTFTGPAAAIGIPYRQASELFPSQVAGKPVKWIVLDDGGDPAAAVKNARRFVDEDQVDAIMGSTSPPGSMAMFDVATESKTPQLSLAPVPIPADKRTWLFNVPQAVPIMVSAIVDDMAAKKVKTVGYIGFTDSWGDQNYAALQKLAEAKGIKVVGNERYNRVDTSVTAQALKIFTENPDVVFIGGSASPAVLPHLALRDLGYKGQIYHSHGSVSRPVLQAGGKSLEGSIAPTGPVIVADELPDSYPTKKAALDFIRIYEEKWGKGTRNPFAGYAWDGMLVVTAAIPEALKGGEPGTPAFRDALRKAIESGKEVQGTHAVYRYTPEDHYGVDQRARVLVVVKDGAFRLLPN